MSTFSGILDEISGISIDRFDYNFKNSSEEKILIYFLSHFHTDHMVGINDLPRVENHVVYASPITMSFINSRYPAINVKPLEIGYSETITVNGIQFTVTSLPSGHCPGSVMFLFETTDGNRILYTGDFRIASKDLNKMIELQKPVDSLYVDSTFFKKEYSHFPRQSESIEKIYQIISEFIQQNSTNKILLKFPARIGYEYLLIELHKRLKQKIYVNKELYEDFYQAVSCLGSITSCSNFESSQVHVISNFNELQNYINCEVQFIKPTAMIWRNWHPGQEIFFKQSCNTFRVCYSNHSSYEEIKDLLLLTKSKKIVLNVLPTDEAERAEFLGNVKNIQEIYSNPLNSVPLKKIEDDHPIKFGSLKSVSNLDDSKSASIESKRTNHFETLDSSILLPIKKKKRSFL